MGLGATENARFPLLRSNGKRGSIENEGVEIAAPEGRGGKRGRNDYGKPKFRFCNRLVCPRLQQPISNDVTHLYILYKMR